MQNFRSHSSLVARKGVSRDIRDKVYVSVTRVSDYGGARKVLTAHQAALAYSID